MSHLSSKDQCVDNRGEYIKVPTGDPEADSASSPVDTCRVARLGIARLFASLHDNDNVDVEKSSVYGSALAIPQLARSAGWPFNLTLLALRSWLFLALNVFLQGVLLFMIDKSEEVMDKFSGQPKLCDFGADIAHCPDGPGCTGPGGTQYTPARLYTFHDWVTRNFVRDSLKAVFPDKADQIDQLVDPGEFGQESRACRFLCCFLFMASLMSELISVLNVGRMLWRLPTRADSWVQYEPAVGAEARILITGMPPLWKIINWVFVWLPKLVLWRLTVSAAMNFLLDTEQITDVIINTVALNFILSIDEMLYESLTSPETRCLMDAVECYNLADKAPGEDSESKELESEEHSFSLKMKLAIPIKLIAVIMFTIVFIFEYYYFNCTKSEEGAWISRVLFQPTSTSYPLASFLFPWIDPPHVPDKVLWQMPKKTGH